MKTAIVTGAARHEETQKRLPVRKEDGLQSIVRILGHGKLHPSHFSIRAQPLRVQVNRNR